MSKLKLEPKKIKKILKLISVGGKNIYLKVVENLLFFRTNSLNNTVLAIANIDIKNKLNIKEKKLDFELFKKIMDSQDPNQTSNVEIFNLAPIMNIFQKEEVISTIQFKEELTLGSFDIPPISPSCMAIMDAPGPLVLFPDPKNLLKNIKISNHNNEFVIKFTDMTFNKIELNLATSESIKKITHFSNGHSYYSSKNLATIFSNLKKETGEIKIKFESAGPLIIEYKQEDFSIQYFCNNLNVL